MVHCSDIFQDIFVLVSPKKLIQILNKQFFHEQNCIIIKLTNKIQIKSDEKNDEEKIQSFDHGHELKFTDRLVSILNINVNDDDDVYSQVSVFLCSSSIKLPTN